ncbi:MAG: undecaprenyldiphospho-muramoylpentapeptide beta-N-acetylglucosaminyltransferase [Bacteroidales bacterium]|nr:undecaprenyldiphospho-muramoylpentapeptide beta-N-acetylglucosaminyltransferase [Bacteroidales bacterium]MDD4215769.1 undecaprenyldiphospho-muramoylpentapeptide beta-N-acetylglucosaminyltransferase [Bacteroidales bacterium]MDY0140376.1 undecaprenyldiphospho-muramoylpentapeptide beta-N-acetylglucosaminyltransferase [Bacteroidales bacterium]
MNKKFKVIVSGGGTGGHIFPAVAIANALQKKFPEVEILFIGAEGRMEMEKVPAAGYKIIGLPVIGMKRKLSPQNITFIIKLLKSLRKVKKIIKEFEPLVVVGVGGYASGPAMRSASNMKIPCLIQEQNSYPGITNKLMAKRAAKICVAYDNMDNFFPAEKIIKTGNPVRQDITNLDAKRNEAFKHFNLNPQKQTILVVGGSLGARTINHSIAAGLEEYIKNDIQVIWQTGKTYIATAKEQVEQINSKNIYVSDFIYKMDFAFSAADIIISRAGASTISELCIVGKPAIFVPSPNVAEDHQTKNALALSSKDAAILVKDSESVEKLNNIAIELIKNQEQRKTFSENIKKLALLNSAELIADEVYKLAYGK